MAARRGPTVLPVGSGGPNDSGMTDAQAAFTLRDIDRSASSLRFQIATIRWLYAPFLALTLVAMVAGIVLGIGERGPLIGGALLVGGAVVALVSAARKHQDEVLDLEEEREDLLRRFPGLGRRRG